MKKILLLATFAFTTNIIAQNDSKGIFSELEKEAQKIKTAQGDSSRVWKKGGLIGIVGQQVSLTNWAAGGQNSISAAGMASVFAGYHKGDISWDNMLDLSYGVVKQGDNKEWWKNDDRIQISSKFGKKAFGNWSYTGLFDFKTQFAPGYNYPNDSVKISEFLAPGYALAALGLDYKPDTSFSFFVAPITGKFTIVNNDTLAKYGAFGVQKEEYDPLTGLISKHYKNHREEFGGYVRMIYKRNVMENVSFMTSVELFSNYLDRPENIDVNWSTLTTMKVNKYISATLSTYLIYDDDVKITADANKDGIADFNGPRVQFKQVFGVGLQYRF
jgi:hypothetical protein